MVGFRGKPKGKTMKTHFGVVGCKPGSRESALFKLEPLATGGKRPFELQEAAARLR